MIAVAALRIIFLQKIQEIGNELNSGVKVGAKQLRRLYNLFNDLLRKIGYVDYRLLNRTRIIYNQKGAFMSKRILLPLLMAFTSITFSTGCSLSGNKSEKITVTDMLGETVAINKNPKKVACISRTTYDLMVAYGLGDKIDGVYGPILKNKWTSLIYPESKNHYSYGYENSYELFISRGVDLVFAPEKYIADDLKNHGIPALNVSLYGKPTFDNYVTFFSKLVSKIWDTEEVKTKASAWEKKVASSISDIQSELSKHSLPKQKVFYIRGDKDKGIGYTDNKGSFTEYAYRVMGFDFVGSSLTTNRPSIEEIVAADPDVFVAGGIYQNKHVEDLKTTEPYKLMDAVKNDKIYTIPNGFTPFEQLSAMTPIFFYDQANKIYPEYFSYDISSMIKETIKEYFGTNLTDEQVSYMQQGLDVEGGSLI